MLGSPVGQSSNSERRKRRLCVSSRPPTWCGQTLDAAADRHRQSLNLVCLLVPFSVRDFFEVVEQ